MKTRSHNINLIEEYEENQNKYLYSNKKGNYINSDENYEDPEYDPSFIIKRDLRGNLKRNIGKKFSSTKTKEKINSKNNGIQNNIFLRKSFNNSLGGDSSKKKINNKENIGDKFYFIKSNFRDYTNQITNSKIEMPYIEKSQKNIIINNINSQEKRIIDTNLDKGYFYQDLTSYEWKEISNFISHSLSNKYLKEEDINSFFCKFPNLTKGENNIIKLRKILEDSSINNRGIFSFFIKKTIELDSYKKLNNYIVNTYYMVKPSIFEVHFFPNSSEEIHLINLLSKTKLSLDIAMFTINNVRIAEEIKNLFYKGIKLRIISDSECIKMATSNIYSLASIGINIKTDDSVRYHMHHKFCVIDNSVVVTGSFNWTDQAVKHNQENLLFLENKNLAMKYSNEFQKLWNDFEIVVTKEKALQKIKDEEEKKRIIENRKKKEKEKKLMEQENKGFEIKSYGYKKIFSKKKRNREDIESYNTYNIMYNNENNNENTNENKGYCFIF